jgi:Zn-dependent metalloprotease
MNEMLHSPRKRYVTLLAVAGLTLVLVVIFSFSTVQGRGAEKAANPVQSAKMEAAAGDNDVSGIREAVSRLRADTNDAVVVTYSRSTPAVNYVRLDGALVLTDGASAEAEALAFFNSYGGIFGMADPASELAYMGSQVDAAGNSHLSFQQAYQGVPVFGGVLRFHLNRA